MGTWFFIIVSLAISVLLKLILTLYHPPKKTAHNLPPGPFTVPFIGNIQWRSLTALSYTTLEPTIRSLHAKFGPIITLHSGSRPTIFIADRSLAHQALIQKGAIFADRPPVVGFRKITTSNQHLISAAFYGPTWRLLRRNLTAEILHSSRVSSFSSIRKWVLQILVDRMESDAKSGDPVSVLGNFRHAMFCLLCLMCFGDEVDEAQISKVEEVQLRMLLNRSKFDVLNFLPAMAKILFRKRWELFSKLKKDQADVMIPLIRARRKGREGGCQDDHAVPYVDTLFSLVLPDENRKLDDKEIITLCSEFLNAGTDSTAAALQWIMANLVKFPQIQEKLVEEIKGVLGNRDQEQVQEEDLQKMPYLKAIVLEGLRRHSPGRFLLPHAVTEDVVLDKYLIPKNAKIIFMNAEMGCDPKVWEDPMEFKPERFLNRGVGEEEFDITGSREIKMMPFGAGRRMCPGYGFAMLHLEYFVANLVWKFEWKAVEGEGVDLAQKEELSSVMKNPLRVYLSPRTLFE